MIKTVVGGIVGGIINPLSSFIINNCIPGIILCIIILYLTTHFFNRCLPCMIYPCGTTYEGQDFETKSEPYQTIPAKEKQKSKQLYTKISDIVQKNLGISARDLILNHE